MRHALLDNGQTNERGGDQGPRRGRLRSGGVGGLALLLSVDIKLSEVNAVLRLLTPGVDPTRRRAKIVDSRELTELTR